MSGRSLYAWVRRLVRRCRDHLDPWEGSALTDRKTTCWPKRPHVDQRVERPAHRHKISILPPVRRRSNNTSRNLSGGRSCAAARTLFESACDTASVSTDISVLARRSLRFAANGATNDERGHTDATLELPPPT